MSKKKYIIRMCVPIICNFWKMGRTYEKFETHCSIFFVAYRCYRVRNRTISLIQRWLGTPNISTIIFQYFCFSNIVSLHLGVEQTLKNVLLLYSRFLLFRTTRKIRRNVSSTPNCSRIVDSSANQKNYNYGKNNVLHLCDFKCHNSCARTSKNNSWK